MPMNPRPGNTHDREHQIGIERTPATSTPRIEIRQSLIPEQTLDLENQADLGILENSQGDEDIQHPDEGFAAPFNANLSSSELSRAETFQLEDDHNVTESSPLQCQLTSQHIYLTLAMDLLPSEMPDQFPFSYFLEEVDTLHLSPFEHLNWTRVKKYISELGVREPSVATAILAVQAVYRSQAQRLSISYAMSLYQSTAINFESTSCDDSVDFNVIIVILFLLCLIVVTLSSEDDSTIRGLDGAFVTRLETWLLEGNQSPVLLRIGAWLLLLDTATKRGGGLSLLPGPVSSLLHEHSLEPSILSMLDCETTPANALYDIISAPVFSFYLHVQTISHQVADLSHYRRSRITPEDQAEVNDILTSLKTRLCSLWDARPGPLQLQPSELREHFSHPIAEPLIALAGLCIAAYFAEVVAIRRILGDPPFPSPESKDAMERIHDIVEGDWNASNGHELNPGYLRPLFLYAIESFSRDGTKKAVDSIRQIKAPLSRSEFVASLAESLAEAQRNSGRRVTMKYFCYRTFNVPLPYM